MKTLASLKYWLLALLALTAVAAIAGHPVLPVEALAGLGMLPLTVGNTELEGLAAMLEKQGKSFEEFKARYDRRIATVEGELGDVLKKNNRPGGALLGAGDGTLSAEEVEQKAAFLGYCRTGREIDSKSMSMGVDPEGGYLVPTILDREISKVLTEFSPMRQLARVVTPGSEDFSMIHSVGGTGYSWVGETESRPETDSPEFMQIKPPVGEIYAFPKITQRLLDDNAFNLEGWLQDELTEAFSVGEGAAFITGDGLKKPMGILSYTASSSADGVRANDQLQYVATGASGAFAEVAASDKLISLVHALKPRYRRGAAWLMNTNTLEQIRTLKDGAGNYLFKAGIEGGQPDTILGYPVYEDENMPDIAANSLSIAFGNFLRGYVIVDRTTTMIRDPFTAKPFVGFYTTKRVGGAMRDFRAIKLLKFSAS